MVQFDTSRSDFQPYGFRCERWTPSMMPRADRHNEIEMNLVLGGTLTYLLGGRRVTMPAGRVAAFWGAVPHQIVGADGTDEYYVLTIPLSWFLQCQFPEALVRQVLGGHVLLDPREDGIDTLRFSLWEENLAVDPASHQRPVFLEVEARLLRLALSLRRGGAAIDAPPPAIEADQLGKVEQMAAFIAMNYTEPLSTEAVGEHVNLHPNHAMTLFKRGFGTTLGSYITQHRVSHAQRLLTTGDEKVIAVALQSGFGSLSRFNAAFRAACGCSPREYRKRHRLQ